MEWIAKYWPEGCSFQYERRFQVPGTGPDPPLVEAEVTATRSVAGARGFELRLTGVSGGSGNREVKPAPAIGDAARLFRSDQVNVEGHSGDGSLLFWRVGKLLAVVLVAGDVAAADDRIALQLAQVQQSRIEAPTPYTEAERDDPAGAGRPRPRGPRLLLGPSFEPSGLAPASLLEAFTFSGPGEGPPGDKVALWYDGFTVDAWTRAGWRSFKRSPDRYYAIAHIGRMVIGIDLILCTRCLGPGHGPYNSLAGMKAIVRGLTLRPKPVY